MNTKELKELTESFNFIKASIDASMERINEIKGQLREFFSDNLQDDETPVAAARRNQIKNNLLEFTKE
jgi:hypothetical protein